MPALKGVNAVEVIPLTRTITLNVELRNIERWRKIHPTFDACVRFLLTPNKSASLGCARNGSIS